MKIPLTENQKKYLLYFCIALIFILFVIELKNFSRSKMFKELLEEVSKGQTYIKMEKQGNY